MVLYLVTNRNFLNQYWFTSLISLWKFNLTENQFAMLHIKRKASQYHNNAVKRIEV